MRVRINKEQTELQRPCSWLLVLSGVLLLSQLYPRYGRSVKCFAGGAGPFHVGCIIHYMSTLDAPRCRAKVSVHLSVLAMHRYDTFDWSTTALSQPSIPSAATQFRPAHLQPSELLCMTPSLTRPYDHAPSPKAVAPA